MHTKVCADLFTNKCPYDACVALPCTCPPRGVPRRPRRAARGAHGDRLAPEHAGAPRASPGNLTGLSTLAAARASPPPPGLGPRGQHPSRPAPGCARRWGWGGQCPGGASQRLRVFIFFKRLRRTVPAPSAARAGGSERSEAGGGDPPPRRAATASPAPPVRGAPPPPAPPPRARPAQAARVCFAARPPPPRASRAHLCLAGPHSSLPSVECLSRWLLRTVWLFPLVTAFTFCLNSSPRSRPSPARRLPPPPAACAPAPPPAAGAPPLATWGPAPRSPPPPARRPSPAPSARRGYNCLSPPGGVILGVVGGGGGGGEEGNFLVPPFPGGGSGVGGHRFQVSAGGRTPRWGRPRAGAGGAGGGGRGGAGPRGDGRKWNMHFSTWPFGELGFWWGRGRQGRHLGCPIPPFSSLGLL